MKINIINACSDLGVAIDGARLGPKKIKEYIKDDKRISNIIDLEPINNTKSNDSLDLAKNIDMLNEFNERLYKNIINLDDKNCINIALGGDHSISIASTLASVKKQNSLGIIWIDTHPDFNTFETTVTGNIHGLPLSTITNNNKNRLTRFHDGNFIKNKNAVIVGARDIDPPEKINLELANIKVYTTNDIKTKNIADIISESIKIASNNTNGIHISLDIDVLDPKIAPGISTSFDNGLTKEELFEILIEILKYKDKIKSIDIVEFNPLNDQNNKTLKIIIEILQIFISNLSKEKSATR